MCHLCYLFVDDCILYRKINSPTDIDILQNDLKEKLRSVRKYGRRNSIIVENVLY